MRVPRWGEALPRAFGDGYTPAGRPATDAELVGTLQGSCTRGHYSPKLNKIVVPDGCSLTTLRHEQQHVRDWCAGIRDRAELERRAMREEVRCLVYEQGWTIEQLKTLSRLNAAVTDATYAEILK